MRSVCILGIARHSISCAATQLTDKYGFYNGNENTTNVPEHVIEAGRQIMENGVNQGFFGVAGFDLLVDEDDNVYAIDLNFRQMVQRACYYLLTS